MPIPKRSRNLAAEVSYDEAEMRSHSSQNTLDTLANTACTRLGNWEEQHSYYVFPLRKS
ncbi:hypothetical protein [Chlorogloeopsis fritschii]|uniref:hypothetical protein n=1 Tax=Chlorogloeopsis fritschii TaxID=1124 RepID=UPI0023F6CA72|nr:hypothetical protein [Chlorogloeopsis fritschii]